LKRIHYQVFLLLVSAAVAASVAAVLIVCPTKRKRMRKICRWVAIAERKSLTKKRKNRD